MSEFTARPLRALDRIYRFVGGMVGPKRFASESEIQPVHDLSREAEIGSGIGGALGFYTRGPTDAHVGTGIIFGSFDPYEMADTHFDQRSRLGVWMMGAWCSTDAMGAVRFVNAGVAVALPEIPGTFGAPFETNLLTHAWFDEIMEIPVNEGHAANQTEGSSRALQYDGLPLYLPDGTIIHHRTEATTNVVEISIRILFWIGARGARPPGVA